MPALTNDEKRLFDAAQLTQLNRLTARRRDEFLTPEEPDNGEFRASMLAKLARRSPVRLRARVNVIGVARGGMKQVVNYAPENDYTDAEMEAIADGLTQGSGWDEQMADITQGGPSTKQRLTALESR